jgi:hypothetical protein
MPAQQQALSLHASFPDIMLKQTLTIFSLTFTLSSCLSNELSDGSDTIIKQSSNPRQDKKVILFLREAGATVPDSYQVTVMDFGDKFDKTSVGNIFTVDTDHGKTWLDSTSINFNWLSNDTLQIDYNKKLRTFIQEKSIDGVIIIYKTR